MKIIKELKGHSGSQILLIEDPDTRVRKIGNVIRNIERINVLKNLGLPFPEILSYDQNLDHYDMKYIINLDIKTYLHSHSVKELGKFLISTIEILSHNSEEKDYTNIYVKKLSGINFDPFIFDLQDLMDVLPRKLPKSQYHGDLTLENILFDIKKEKFVLIDPLTTEYDSYVFDLAKLRQDISCCWFIRNDHNAINGKLQQLYEMLSVFDYFKNDSIVILMMLRVLSYLSPGPDFNFIIREINKLWKLSYLAQD